MTALERAAELGARDGRRDTETWLALASGFRPGHAWDTLPEPDVYDLDWLDAEMKATDASWSTDEDAQRATTDAYCAAYREARDADIEGVQ